MESWHESSVAGSTVAGSSVADSALEGLCHSGLLKGQEELELGGQLLLGVQAVREVDAADAAVGMDLDAQRLYVVGACTHVHTDVTNM